MAGEIGTKGGLLTDADARVLNAAGQPIEGLYCTGNNAVSVMGPAYPALVHARSGDDLRLPRGGPWRAG